ncbi:MAG: methyltransferase domain-containing protein [Egibacteraceae bacterium]
MARVEWTAAQKRHLAAFFGFGSPSAPLVYDSLGSDFFAALAGDWLNLGLWEGPGTEDEAAVASRRLVEALTAPLPERAAIMDVGNGLGASDEVIAERLTPERLVALNITLTQLRAGRGHLRAANAQPVCADASRLPLADDRFDGLISVEAAFHFPSRARFLAEAARVLRPGGVLSFSDVITNRFPRTPGEVLAGLTSLRFWALDRGSVVAADQLTQAITRAGFTDVRLERVGQRVFTPVLSYLRQRLTHRPEGVPVGQWRSAQLMVSQWDLLWRRGVIDYVLVSARLNSSARQPG